MSLLAQEAARELFLLHLGVHAPQAIISWADSAIEREAEPPAALLDLSTTSVDRIDRFIELLSELKSGCDYWSATRDALSEVYGFVTAHPEEAERIAGALWMASSWGGNDLPADLRFVTRFEDAFYLGREGYYGSEEEVFRDFLSELSRFRKEPNKSPEPTTTAVTPRAAERKAK